MCVTLRRCRELKEKAASSAWLCSCMSPRGEINSRKKLISILVRLNIFFYFFFPFFVILCAAICRPETGGKQQCIVLVFHTPGLGSGHQHNTGTTGNDVSRCVYVSSDIKQHLKSGLLQSSDPKGFVSLSCRVEKSATSCSENQANKLVPAGCRASFSGPAWYSNTRKELNKMNMLLLDCQLQFVAAQQHKAGTHI